MTIEQAAQIVARLLFSAFFVMAGAKHLMNVKGTADYARAVGKVPAAEVAVVLSGLMLLAGGAGVLLGFHPRIAAGLLFVFLVPTAFLMHAYWKVEDPMQKAGESAHFWKNITLAGAALYIAANPHWPWPWAIG